MTIKQFADQHGLEYGTVRTAIYDQPWYEHRLKDVDYNEDQVRQAVIKRLKYIIRHYQRRINETQADLARVKGENHDHD